ncbi:hypothetical protein Tco_0003660 [Tanacetum coccineum]
MLCQQEQTANLSTLTPEPSRHFNSICYDDDDDEESTIPLNEIISQIPPSIAITPVLPTMESEDPLIMGDENLSTIPEKELDEFIQSSVEVLVPIPKEKSMTFSNSLFDSNDDFTSSDDESLSDKDVPEDNRGLLLYEPNLLVTPLSKLNEDECFDLGGDFVLEEIKACLTSDSIPPGIDDDDFNPEGYILLLEKLLNDDSSSLLSLRKNFILRNLKK